MAGADHAGGRDEVALGELDGRGASHPADGRDAQQPEGQRDRHQPPVEQRGDEDREHQRRERQEHDEHERDRTVEQAAEVPGEQAERAADQQAEHDRHHTHHERHAGAVDGARQHVTGERVGTERRVPRRAGERPVAPSVAADRLGVVERQPGRQQRRARHEHQPGRARPEEPPSRPPAVGAAPSRRGAGSVAVIAAPSGR